MGHSNDNTKPEEWRTCTFGLNSYEVSSKGRVRNSHGYIMKQRLKGGYLKVNLSKNGKHRDMNTSYMKTHLHGSYQGLKIKLVTGESVHKLVHVLVAEAFNEPSRPEQNIVNHLDTSKINNASSNLEWVTESENVRHAMLAGVLKHKTVPVEQIDASTGQVIKEFESIKLVCQQFGLHRALLRKAMMENLVAAEYRWRYKYESDKSLRKTSGKSRQVQQLDINGHIIATFESLKEAAEKMQVHSNNISAACNGRNDTCGGFKWKYKDEKDKVSNHIPKRKYVEQLDEQSNIIATFRSQAEAAKKLSISIHAIGHACRGTQKAAGGFKFRFKQTE
jgi:hypothetical protein